MNVLLSLTAYDPWSIILTPDPYNPLKSAIRSLISLAM
jgi:hypothetical protein